MIDGYQQQFSNAQITQQLFVGLKKHLILAQTTSWSKDKRLLSLKNIAEVLEYVVLNINTEISKEERELFLRFFELLLVKVTKAIIQIHHTPMSFDDEIGFISTILNIKA